MSESIQILKSDGTIIWKNTQDLWHRINGPAVVRPDGNEQWWYQGVLHRENGPAYLGSDGYQAWYIHGERHRRDGPARIWPDGSEEWQIDGQTITNEVEKWAEENNISMNWKTWDDIEWLHFRLRF